ncbi:MAG: PHP domain-containing protein [Eubacteriales bacterium]
MAGDLHCHTRLSDGSMGIDDLIILAKKQGIDKIAITDHDCLAGTVRGRLIGERHGVTVIPGVELSATDSKRGRKVHILCYLSDSPDRLEGLCRRNLIARKRASQHMVIKVAQRYPASPELIVKCASGSTNIYKQHIMHALMECGITDQIFGSIYDELFSRESDINVIVDAKFPEPSEIIEAIHDAGGIAILAHPALFESLELLDDLIMLGLDGVEVWHPQSTEEQINYLKAVANKNNLLMTGGSDFHGMYGKGSISIGDLVTPDEQMTLLLSYKARQRRQQQKAAAEA